jgi:hypothetical protein
VFLYIYIKKHNMKVNEGFTPEGTPDLKYYAFDWDDNIVHMPTRIILKDDEGDNVGMSTQDFAEYRHKIGKEPFKYKGDTIVGYSEDPFRNFRVTGDKDFLIDAMSAEPGPAFEDFKEAINNGSIFSIITARGHNPRTLKEAVYNYIVSNFNGISKEELIKNLKKYRSFVDEEDMSDEEIIRSYLELNQYHPVSFGDDKGAVNPEEAKVEAMEEFVSYVKSMATLLGGKAYLKKDIANNFIPDKLSIGFSDDDPKNVEVMKKHFEKKPDNIVKTYSTSSGVKQEI